MESIEAMLMMWEVKVAGELAKQAKQAVDALSIGASPIERVALTLERLNLRNRVNYFGDATIAYCERGYSIVALADYLGSTPDERAELVADITNLYQEYCST
jgi:hypothetical protein